MSETRQLCDWDHTASILSAIHGFGSEKPPDPLTLNPIRIARSQRVQRSEENTTTDGGFATATIDDVIGAFVSKEE